MPNPKQPHKPRRDFAAEITDRIVARLEGGETLPWRHPWLRRASALPRRHCGEPYRGINHLFLSIEGFAKGFTSPYWMTFRQAKAFEAMIRKGETATPVVYYGVSAKHDAGDDNAAADPDQEDGDVYRFLKGYSVFNADQIDGLPERFHPSEAELDTGARPIAELEAFFARLPVPIRTGFDKAAYREATDDIAMPEVSRFEEASRFYAVALHEMGHATGIPSRLGRDCFARYHHDIAERAREELIAELTSVLAAPRLDLPVDHLDDHAAYLQSWLKALKSDKRHIFRAAAEAQRAADWIFAAAGEVSAEIEAAA